MGDEVPDRARGRRDPRPLAFSFGAYLLLPASPISLLKKLLGLRQVVDQVPLILGTKLSSEHASSSPNKQMEVWHNTAEGP